MRLAALNLFLIATLLGSATGQTAFSDDDDQQAIRRSMLAVEKAFVARDPEPLERVYLEGYVGIRGKPVFNTREQLAAMIRYDAAAIRSGKKLAFETLSYESDPPSVIIIGDVAIVNVLKKNLWRYKEDRCLSQYQTTELWLKRDEWKAAASHVSTIQCDPMPWQPPHPALANLRPLLRPVKFLSTTVETELRELLSKLSDSGVLAESGDDAFVSEFVSTGIEGNIGRDRAELATTLKLPTGRNNERFRDDEIFLSFGNAAMYVFRVRSFAKGNEAPPPPVVHSVIFVKKTGGWKIAAWHASTLGD